MSVSIEIPYIPSAKQKLFHDSSADEVLYGGAAGGGKSKAIVMEALMRGLETPGAQIYLFRRSYSELEDTLILEARRSIPAALGSYNGTRHDYTLRNGSVLKFRHCFAENDRFLYQGAEIHYLFIDELTHFPHTIYEFLKTRLRADKRIGIRPLIRATSNPGGVGHSWVKRYFIDAPPFKVHERSVYSDVLNQTQTRTVQYIPAYATDNPHLTADYIFELEQKPTALKNALLYGKWDAFEGQVFQEFRDNPEGYISRQNTHVIQPFRIPDHYFRFRSFDFGYAKPFAVLWWCADPDGCVYLYREWYGCTCTPNTGIRLNPRAIARGILEAERGESIQGSYADPSIFDASRGESVAAQMADEGVYFERAENARLSGKMQLHYRLQFDENGFARIAFFNTCTHTLRTLPALPYADDRPEDVDTRAEDHIYDACRYFLMTRPVSPALVPPRHRFYNPLETQKPAVSQFLSR